MRFIYTLICLSFIVYTRAQQKIEIQLLDSVTKQPIEFANAGILGKGFGTVSDDQGRFVLNIPDSLMGEKLLCTMIGYRAKSLVIKNLKATNIVKLAPHGNNFNEVTVSAKKMKFKIAGNEARGSFVSIGFNKNNLGAEMSVRLNIKHENTELKRFYLNILGNKLKEKPIFRFNVYKVSKDGSPGENILSQNIIIEPVNQTGLIDFDLSPYKIVVNEDVFISVEWVKDLGNATDLFFSGKLGGADCYFRNASQDKWQKVPVVGVGLHAQIAY